ADTDIDQLEQFLDVTVPHADAAVRGGFTDRARRIRSVDSVALEAQAHPASAQWVVLAGRYRPAQAVPGGVREAGGHAEFAYGRRRAGLADRDVVSLEDVLAVNERQRAIGNADDDPESALLFRNGNDSAERHQRHGFDYLSVFHGNPE